MSTTLHVDLLGLYVAGNVDKNLMLEHIEEPTTLEEANRRLRVTRDAYLRLLFGLGDALERHQRSR